MGPKYLATGHREAKVEKMYCNRQLELHRVGIHKVYLYRHEGFSRVLSSSLQNGIARGTVLFLKSLSNRWAMPK